MNLVRRCVAITIAVVFTLSAGCAHSPHTRGSVALKENSERAHVCLGEGEVKKGDNVALYKNECSGVPGSSKQNARENITSYSCRKVKLGEGEVIEVQNEHYSIIQVEPGVGFEEGAIVEKIR